MYKPEKVIEHKYAKYAASKGCVALKFTPESRAGYPDRLTLLPKGRVFWIEFKALGKKASELQCRIHDELRALGFEVYICDTFLEAKTILDTKLK